MSSQPPRLAITAGEPAGIGPDLCLSLAARGHGADWVVLGSRDVLLARARLLGLDIVIKPFTDAAPAAKRAGELTVLDIPTAAAVSAGRLDAANAAHVLALLDTAAQGCLNGRFDAVVTAPVHKGVINDAGVAFSGHTEYLAAACGPDAYPVMMLACPGLRVALATTHLPLRAVADAITPALLERVLTIIDADLRERFAIASPRIKVCGLNPHAGEGGHLGREELDVIIPVLDRLRARGLDLYGPLPADTLFTPRVLADADAVLAMYHDQGLPVLKHAGFGEAVNITLGLPLIRTSVDHGTALDLAGSGRAESGSLLAAIDLAATLAASRT